jgi:hypothetical protein
LTNFDLRVQQIHRWVNQAPTVTRTDQRRVNVSTKDRDQPDHRQSTTSQNEKTVAMVVGKNLDSRRQKHRDNRYLVRESSRRQSHQRSWCALEQNANPIDAETH